MDQIIEWLCTQDEKRVYELLRGLFMQGAITALMKVGFDEAGDQERLFTETGEWLDAEENRIVEVALEEIETMQLQETQAAVDPEREHR